MSEFTLLAQATRALGGTLDLGRLLGRLTELAQDHLGADAAGVWLLERGGTELALRGDVGFKHPEVVARLAHPPGRDVLSWISERPGPIVLRRLPGDAQPDARRWLEGEEIRSLLGVPLLGDAAPLGALALFRRSRRPFTRVDLALAETLCVPAAPAILNARLYAEQLGRAERTEILLAENARLYREAQAQAAGSLQRAEELAALQRKLIQGETLRALGELAGGAAHHLNNLLTIVVGRIQLLRRMVEEERLARPLEIVERAAKDGAEVVRRLQQFAGMRRTAEPQAVDLGQIITDALELTRDRWQDAARPQGTEITVESRVAPLPPLPGDAAALRELLTNLVLNAVDALPRGGRLTVEATPVEGHIVVSVSDTGVGMSEEVRQRAHEPFFTTKGVKATGLGLSVAFGIARRHGGELTVQSDEGHGTTVRVTLPLAEGS